MRLAFVVLRSSPTWRNRPGGKPGENEPSALQAVQVLQDHAFVSETFPARIRRVALVCEGNPPDQRNARKSEADKTSMACERNEPRWRFGNSTVTLSILTAADRKSVV